MLGPNDVADVAKFFIENGRIQSSMSFMGI